MAHPLLRTETSSDATLIRAWQAGDEQAAAELVGRHARPLARLLAGAGAPDADVDDLVQETLIRAFRSVDRFRGQCQFRTWLLTIGSNVLKDFGRRAARRKVVPLDEAVRDVTGDPHEHAEASEAEALLTADRAPVWEVEESGPLPTAARSILLARIGAPPSQKLV